MALTRHEKGNESKLAKALARAEFHQRLRTALDILDGTHVARTTTKSTRWSEKQQTYVTTETTSESSPTPKDKLAALELLERVGRLRPQDDEQGKGPGSGGIASPELTRAFINALADPITQRWLLAQPHLLQQVRLLAAQEVPATIEPSPEESPTL